VALQPVLVASRSARRVHKVADAVGLVSAIWPPGCVHDLIVAPSSRQFMAFLDSQIVFVSLRTPVSY